MKLFRTTALLTTASFAWLQNSTAGPVNENYIAADALWLAHVDLEAFVESSLSEPIVERLKEEMEESNDSAISINIDQVLEDLKSVTAYGNKLGGGEKAGGVLVLRTGERMQAVVDGFIAHQELTGEAEFKIEELADKPFRSFLLGEDLYFSYPEEGLIIASKTFEEIEAAYEVFVGDSPSLRSAGSRLLLSDNEGFFLLASATGLDRLKDMPTQARILQKTTGGQISIGEIEKEFRASVTLATSGPEVSEQLERIVQGMIALASFTEVEDASVADLLSSIEVLPKENSLSVNFSYPVEELANLVEKLIEESYQKKGNRKSEKRKHSDDKRSHDSAEN